MDGDGRVLLVFSYVDEGDLLDLVLEAREILKAGIKSEGRPPLDLDFLCLANGGCRRGTTEEIPKQTPLGLDLLDL